MANIIHVSPEKLAGTAKRFEQTAGEVRMICRNMTGTVQALSGRIWSGILTARSRFSKEAPSLFQGMAAGSDTLFRKTILCPMRLC